MSHLIDHDNISAISVNDHDSTGNNDKYELFKLQQQEEYRRQIFVQHRCDLQDTWDNLVKLRQLIQVFCNNVEKTSEEEIKEYELKNHSSSDLSSKGLTTSNNRFKYDTYMNDIKLKSKTKDELKLTLVQKDALLQQMKLDLDLKSNQLMSFNSNPQLLSYQQYSNETISSTLPNNTNNFSPNTMTNVSSYIELRAYIFQLSNQIEVAEKEYLELSLQYTQLDSEITQAYAETPILANSLFTGTTDSPGTQLLTTNTTATTTTTAASTEVSPMNDGLNPSSNKGFFKVEGGVSMLDVLSGKANIYRMNG